MENVFKWTKIIRNMFVWVGILLGGIVIGHALQLWQEVLPGPEIPPAFQSALEEREFKRLLKKHGLEHDVIVIFNDPLGEYFIRDGRRCSFK